MPLGGSWSLFFTEHRAASWLQETHSCASVFKITDITRTFCFQKGPDGDFCCCTWSLRLLCLAPLNQDLFITAGVKNSACCWSVLIPTPGAHLPRISPNPCAAFHWHLKFFFSVFYLFFSTAFISVITDCYILSIDLSVQIPFQITI